MPLIGQENYAFFGIKFKNRFELNIFSRLNTDTNQRSRRKMETKDDGAMAKVITGKWMRRTEFPFFAQLKIEEKILRSIDGKKEWQ